MLGLSYLISKWHQCCGATAAVRIHGKCMWRYWDLAMHRSRHLKLSGLGVTSPPPQSHSVNHRGLRYLKEDPLPSAQEAAGGRPRFRPHLYPRHCLMVMSRLPASASAYLSTKWAQEGFNTAMLCPGDPANPLMHTTSPIPYPPPCPPPHTQLRKTAKYNK